MPSMSPSQKGVSPSRQPSFSSSVIAATSARASSCGSAPSRTRAAAAANAVGMGPWFLAPPPIPGYRASMSSLEETVQDLARRVRRLEDELAIHRLIASYGLAVDAGDADGSAATFTEDGVYDVDVGVMSGREAVRAMVRGPRHQEMVGHCAHQIGPAVVRIEADDRASALGYSRVYLET